mmetsp:Transcript_15903/g.30776  ORF Transcript_15903/g.30776 Transcript_15903/m.30776 type:complete len:221 (+) Transcript_15903:1321-1983(+)
MRPSLSLRSCTEVANARIAMHSEATAMSNPVSRGTPFFSEGACPMVIPRRCLSQVSTTRFQVIDSGSMSSLTKRETSSGVRSEGLVLVIPSFSRRRSMGLAKTRTSPWSGHNLRKRASSDCVCSWNIRESMAAAMRLLAAITGEICMLGTLMLKSSMGMVCAYPPPLAPPLTPKVGPALGTRMLVKTFLSRWAPSACESPMVVVLLPSPREVGLMPVTRT